MKKLYILLGTSALIAVAAAAIVFQIHHSSGRALHQQRIAWALQEADLQDSLKEVEAAIETELSNRAKMTVPQLEPSALVKRLEQMQNYTNSLHNTEELPLELQLRNQWRDQLREAYFVFQGLIDNGEKSIDTIRDYLQSGHNVILMPSWNSLATSIRSKTKIDTVPRSSRLGLMGVLIYLNSPASMGLLYETMLASSNSTEIQYAARALMLANKEDFRSACVKSLRQMLAADPDMRSIDILYFLKEKCEDDVSDLAMTLEILDPNGKLITSQLHYRLQLMGESALPSIREAFSSPEVTMMERMSALDSVRKYIGVNADADSMVKVMVDNLDDSSIDCMGSVLAMMISDCSERNGFDQKTMTPEMIQSRLNLLNELEQSHGADYAFFQESIGISRNFLNEAAATGVQPDADKMMKQLIESGYMDRMASTMIEFSKNNPGIMDRD